MRFGTSAGFEIDMEVAGAEKEADLGDQGEIHGKYSQSIIFF